MAAAKRELASAIAHAVRDVDRQLVLFGLPGSHMITRRRGGRPHDGGRGVRGSQLHERRIARVAPPARRAGARRRRGGAARHSHGARGEGSSGGRSGAVDARRHDLHSRRRTARGGIRAAAAAARSRTRGSTCDRSDARRRRRAARSEFPFLLRRTCRSLRRCDAASPDRSAPHSSFRRARRRGSARARRDTTE